MANRLTAIQNSRLKKLEEIKKFGIDPYPAKSRLRKYKIAEVLRKLNKKVGVAGRIFAWREHGNSIFADIKDESGKIQLFFQKKNLSWKFELLRLLDVGDFIGVSGRIIKTHSGEITIDVIEFELLTKSLRPLPSVWHGLKDVEERYRQRYVDLLLNTGVRENFLVRTKFVKLLRQWLDQNGFIEVETPVLQPIYGGASARPFITHHNALDVNLYLRIADELYLKRLIVGGFEKVYEIGKDFRNEGIERGRNPEFTQLEFYWAYADYEDLMNFTEKMISSIIVEIKGSLTFDYEGHTLDFTPPWKRVTYRDLIYKEAGIDIDIIDTEEKLLKEIKAKNIQIDLQGISGYGEILDAFYKRIVRPKIVGPVFLIDRPVEMVPLAKKKESNPNRVATFQLVAVGEEFINAYNELNDPLDQKQRWENEMKLAKKGGGEHQVLDEDYIRALEYGMPPTAGWGLGVDRFVMLLTGVSNIKEVILFPTLKPEK